MPTISFTLSDAAVAELVNALCDEYNYVATLPGGTVNPETPTQFARRMHVTLLKDIVVRYRKRQAALAAIGTDPDIT